MTESELIHKIKAGDQDAFRLLVEEHQKNVLNTCYRFLQIKENAEDVTQEVFIEVFRSVKYFRGECKLSTWIYRIAVSRSLDYIKMLNRKKRISKFLSVFDQEEEEKYKHTQDSDNPAKKIENEDRKKILNWALNTLAENQRVAFTLSKYDEFSYQEIAEIMGTTLSSVESLIHRAKTNLKKKLYKYYNNIIT